MLKNSLSAVCCLLAAATLAACATRPPVSVPATQAAWLAHRASIESLTHWQVQGRVAVRADDEGWSAHFDWKQTDQDYQIRLRGPFGQGAVELHGNGQGVWLKRADQAPVFAVNPERLLQQETGWRLPVAGLSSWLRGLPVAEDEHSNLQWDEHGRLLEVEQNGWQIVYRSYELQGDLQLPEKLQLSRDSLLVKFVIDDWQN
jgi:outer membrane lipoprotein LolB